MPDDKRPSHRHHTLAHPNQTELRTLVFGETVRWHTYSVISHFQSNTIGFISNNDLPRFYHMADLFISASHVDGSSVSLMEALACGLPCAVSDIPANREWVTDGVNGWVFPDGDADALETIILKAVGQRESLPRLGGNARITAEEKADWKRNAQKLFSLYEMMVS